MMVKLPVKKQWYKCPACGKNLVLYHNAAKCRGVFVKCKFCRREVEIRI